MNKMTCQCSLHFRRSFTGCVSTPLTSGYILHTAPTLNIQAFKGSECLHPCVWVCPCTLMSLWALGALPPSTLWGPGHMMSHSARWVGQVCAGKKGREKDEWGDGVMTDRGFWMIRDRKWGTWVAERCEEMDIVCSGGLGGKAAFRLHFCPHDASY